MLSLILSGALERVHESLKMCTSIAPPAAYLCVHTSAFDRLAARPQVGRGDSRNLPVANGS